MQIAIVPLEKRLLQQDCVFRFANILVSLIFGLKEVQLMDERRE